MTTATQKRREMLREKAKKLSMAIGGKRALVRAHADDGDDLETLYANACKELITERAKVKTELARIDAKSKARNGATK